MPDSVKFVDSLGQSIVTSYDIDNLYKRGKNEKIFEIKFVEHESVFYQMGKTQVFDMTCELIEYSNQRFNTGRAEIDNYFADYNTDIIVDANNATLTALAATDDNAGNLNFELEADGIIDFSEVDPFSENISISDS